MWLAVRWKDLSLELGEDMEGDCVHLLDRSSNHLERWRGDEKSVMKHGWGCASQRNLLAGDALNAQGFSIARLPALESRYEGAIGKFPD
jgi:hypothetical protein